MSWDATRSCRGRQLTWPPPRRVAPSLGGAYSPPAPCHRWQGPFRRANGHGAPKPSPRSSATARLDVGARRGERRRNAVEQDASPRARRTFWCSPGSPGTCRPTKRLADGHGGPKSSPPSKATARLVVGACRTESGGRAVGRDAPPRARRTFRCSLGSPGTCRPTTCLRWARRCVREVAGTLRPSRAFAVVAPRPTPPNPEERDATPRPWCTCKPLQRRGRGAGAFPF